MTFGEICVAIGEFFRWTFGILEAGENIVNWAFIVLGFLGMIYWLMLQARYNKEAKESGGWE